MLEHSCMLVEKGQCVCFAVAHKVCSRCAERKPAAQFNNNKVSPDGLCSYCKPCNAAAAAQRRRQRAPVTSPTVATKVCSHCHQVPHTVCCPCAWGCLHQSCGTYLLAGLQLCMSPGSQ